MSKDALVVLLLLLGCVALAPLTLCGGEVVDALYLVCGDDFDGYQ